MSHKSRGLALIFNHEKFLDSRCSTRIGTSVDRDKLTRVFTEFNFEVQVFNNLMVDEISDKLFESENAEQLWLKIKTNSNHNF